MDFARVLATLAGFFEREAIRYAVVGAFGLQACGLGRATMDVDLVAEAEAQGRVLAFLESLGYETLHVSSGYSNHVHPMPEMGRVGLVYVGGTPVGSSSGSACSLSSSESGTCRCRDPSIWPR